MTGIVSWAVTLLLLAYGCTATLWLRYRERARQRRRERPQGGNE